MNKLDSITIVGGGTAGLVSALILKTRFPSKEINVVASAKIGIIGVGEGSTEHWSSFMEYTGIDWKEVIRECDATFKSGIMFEGWGEKNFLHSTSVEMNKLAGQYPLAYGYQIGKDSDPDKLIPPQTLAGRIPTNYLDLNNTNSPYSQFHFNTHKLNDFLTAKCKARGVMLYDDEVKDIEINENGNITRLHTEQGIFESDFWIDATGFKRLLIGKLGAKWKSYKEYLKMKSAIVFPIEGEHEYPIWTLAKTMDYGWLFRIPVYGRYGNGYIYDSDYINEDQAKQEVDKLFGRDIPIAKKIDFDPGALDNVWLNNCCAVGLCANFVEPLEATSIGTSIQQMFLLMHRLPNYNKFTIKKYNEDVISLMNNIRDFIILHYITNNTKSQFWKDLQGMSIPDSLGENLIRWKNNLPIADDFKNDSAYSLFKEFNYIHVLNGLGLFDTDQIAKEFEQQNSWAKDTALESIQSLVMPNRHMSHKEFLDAIRSTSKEQKETKTVTGQPHWTYQKKARYMNE